MSLTASYVTMAAAEARLEPASASDADDPRSCPHAAATCPRQRSDSAASRFVLLFFFLGGGVVSSVVVVAASSLSLLGGDEKEDKQQKSHDIAYYYRGANTQPLIHRNSGFVDHTTFSTSSRLDPDRMCGQPWPTDRSHSASSCVCEKMFFSGTNN
jgi:hypothetical protein